MDSQYAWIVVAALIGGAILLVDVGRRRVQRRRQVSDPTAPPEVNDNYTALRLGALTETLAHLGLVAKGEGVKAFGLVVDLGLGNGVVTLSTLITGDISLYVSDGGGAMGGIDEPQIKTAAVAAIKHAEAVIATMAPTKAFPFPAAGRATFYLLLSDRSVFTAEDSMERLAAGESALSPAWSDAHKIFERLGIAAAKSPT